MKKQISAILCMILGIFLFSFPVSAEEQYQSGDWTYEISDGKAKLTSYNGNSKVIDIPGTIDGYTVTELRYSIFEGTEITDVTIPESMVRIGQDAFKDCEYLTNIYFNAEYMDMVYEDTFENAGRKASSLKAVFGDHVKVIPYGLFREVEYLTDVVISDSIEEISSYAFKECKRLNNVTWGNSIEYIGDSAFSDCSQLKEVQLPYTLETLEEDVFVNCINLQSIIINARHFESKMAYGAFANCGADSDSLKVTFGPKVEYVPEKLFYSQCGYESGTGAYPHITEVVFSDSIVEIKSRAFERCYDLKKITWGNNIQTIDSAFDYCNGLTSVNLPKSVTLLDHSAFGNCKNLKSITINNFETEIHFSAFENCSKELIFNCYYKSTTDVFAKDNGFTIKYLTPKKTSLSKIENVSKGVKISWKNAVGAQKYYVYRKNSSGDWKRIGSTTKTSYTDQDVKSGKSYTYTIRAVADTKKGEYDSKGLSLKHLSNGKISSLSNKNTGITIKWNKVAGAAGYYVYRKSGNGGYKKIATIKKGSTVSYSDTSVKSKNGTAYTYAVRAYSGNTCGYYTGLKTVRLVAPTIKKLQNNSGKKFTVTWNKNSKASGYQIQYSTSNSFSSGNKTIKITNASTVSSTVSKLTKGKSYYVRIRSYKTVSGKTYYSEWSSKKQIKISK